MKADAKGPSVIPKEAVRLRILANSDSDKDQALKRKVRDEVKAQIDGWVADLTSFEEARKVIQSHIPEIEKTVENTLKREGSKDSFQVKFSKNVKFPTKVYGNFIYPAGEYEAVLITIGEGEGANWWCVLFPPMCFLDFSSGTAVRKEEHVVKAESPEEEQVKQLDEEVIDKEEKKVDKVKETKAVKQEVVKRVTASEKKVVKNETKVEERPVSKEEMKTVEKVEKPVEKNKKSKMSM